MGQAKKRAEELRKMFLEEIDMLMRPGSDVERLLAEELAQMPTVRATRAPRDQLEWGRMKPKECHLNARFMAENDPEGQTRWLLGWMAFPTEGAWNCHSIVERQGQYICVTPQVNQYAPDQFDFIIDPDLQLGGDNKLYRKGLVFTETSLIRADPQAFIDANASFRQDLLSGMHPNEALKRFNEREIAAHKAA